MNPKLRIAKNILTDKNKKNIFRIGFEFLHYCWIKKHLTIDYFRKSLYRKNATNYRNHLSLKEYYAIIESPELKKNDITNFLDNKLAFALYTEKLDLPTPKLISYNFNSLYFHNNKEIKISNIKELESFFRKLFNSEGLDKLFVKPLNEYGGSNCMLIRLENLDLQIKTFGKTLLSKSFIHQQVIEQHESISLIFPKSVNTLRLDTYLDTNNTPHVLSCVMRFGAGNNVMDNASSGGFFVAVDMKNEILKGPGRQFINFEAKVFDYHPNTKLKIDGFKLPFLKECIDLAKRASLSLPSRIIGWDIAITNQGPMLIEGNSNVDLHMTDMAYGGYLKHPLIQEILKEVS